MAEAGAKIYKDVRSLARGIRLLESLSAMGWAQIGDLASASQIERSSTYRLINTLVELGYVARRNEDGAVALTTKVTRLADGVRQDDIATQFAWPFLYELSRDVLWPCDFAALSGGRLTIRISTHRISPMSIHRGVVGTERPLMRSALGQAILSAMSDEERELSLQVVEQLDVGNQAAEVRDREVVQRMIDRVRERGYAMSVGQTEEKISAIALPVMAPGNRVVGAVNVVFFRSALSPEQAAERYLPKLRNCIAQIEKALEDLDDKPWIAA